MLCGFHVRQADDVLDRMPDLLTHLWSLNGSGPKDDNDPTRGAFGSRWTLSESRLRACEIVMRALTLVTDAALEAGIPDPALPRRLISPFTGFHSTASTRDVAAVSTAIAAWLLEHRGDLYSRRRAALATVRLTGAAAAAWRAFPTVDVAHKVPVLRCRACNRLTLIWKPPIYYLDDDEIRCSACGQVEDRQLLEHDMRVILEVNRKAKK